MTALGIYVGVCFGPVSSLAAHTHAHTATVWGKSGRDPESHLDLLRDFHFTYTWQNKKVVWTLCCSSVPMLNPFMTMEWEVLFKRCIYIYCADGKLMKQLQITDIHQLQFKSSVSTFFSYLCLTLRRLPFSVFFHFHQLLMFSIWSVAEWTLCFCFLNHRVAGPKRIYSLMGFSDDLQCLETLCNNTTNHTAH